MIQLRTFNELGTLCEVCGNHSKIGGKCGMSTCEVGHYNLLICEFGITGFNVEKRIYGNGVRITFNKSKWYQWGRDEEIYNAKKAIMLKKLPTHLITFHEKEN